MSVEDELRTLLRSQVAAPPDNPARPAQVRSRITAIRRRRTAGGALGLVLLALAGLFVLRLPGTTESLPPGVPKPPYFDDHGQARAIPGWSDAGGVWDLEGLNAVTGIPGFDLEHTRYLVTARCERKGDLTVRNVRNGEQVIVGCRLRVGDHFEGIAAVSPEQGRRLSTLTAADVNDVQLFPGSAGKWAVNVLQAKAPERLNWNVNLGQKWPVDGRRTPDGATIEITVPPRREPGVGFDLNVDCVAGVRLEFRVPVGELGSLACDPFAPGNERVSDMLRGRVTLRVFSHDLNRLGLERGERVALTVERSGTVTDQWRLYPVWS